MKDAFFASDLECAWTGNLPFYCSFFLLDFSWTHDWTDGEGAKKGCRAEARDARGPTRLLAGRRQSRAQFGRKSDNVIVQKWEGALADRESYRTLHS